MNQKKLQVLNTHKTKHIGTFILVRLVPKTLGPLVSHFFTLMLHFKNQQAITKTINNLVAELVIGKLTFVFVQSYSSSEPLVKGASFDFLASCNAKLSLKRAVLLWFENCLLQLTAIENGP